VVLKFRVSVTNPIISWNLVERDIIVEKYITFF